MSHSPFLAQLACRLKASALGAIGSTALLVACSGSAADSERVVELGDTITSDSGALRVTIRSGSAESLVRGKNQVEFWFERVSDGAPVDDLEARMTPFMPAMGHGSASRPTASSLGSGRYLFSDVELSMTGLWELQTTVSGAISDYVAPRLEVR